MDTQSTKESRLDRFAENPKKALWSLAIPMLIGMSVQNIYQIVDMIFVGRLGPDAIAALAFNLPLLFFAIGIIFGLGSGVTAVIAQFIGMKSKKKADNAAEHSILLGLGLSAIFSFTGWMYGRDLLLILGTPENILDDAFNYFIILVSGIVFMILSVFFRSILSGEGDNTFPMYVLGTGTVLNIILDPILIFGLDMGVKGAAAATIISQAVVCLVFLYAFFIKKHPYITFSPRDFSFDTSILASILKLGMPASFSMVIMSFGGAIFNRILVHYSADAVSAYQIGSRLDHVFFMPIISIVSSLVTLVGMFYGAKRINLLKTTIHYGLQQALLISVGIGFLFYIFAEDILPLFTNSQMIIDYGVGYLKIIVIAYPFISIGMTSSRVMQGLGFGSPMLFLTLTRVILVSVPLALYFTYIAHVSVKYVWIAMLISSIVSAALAYPWMRFNLQKSKRQVELQSVTS